MADAQITIVDGDQTQIVLAPGENPAIVSSIPGPQGPAGAGVPTGGAANEVLYKVSSTFGDTAWGPVTSAMIGNLQIVDADVSASAAIAGTKISPNFGSQNIVTTGNATAAALIPSSSTVPTNGVYLPAANSVAISTNGTGRLFVDASGKITNNASNTNASLNIVGTISVGDSNASIYTPTHPINITTASYGDTKLIRWMQRESGNARAYIGSIGNANFTADLIFGTNGAISDTAAVERLRITSAGLVGVGTSSPSAIIHSTPASVNGGLATAFLATQAGSGVNTGTALRLGWGASNGAFSEISAALQASGVGTNLDLKTSTDNSTAASTKVRITSAGLVGVGTTSPVAPIHVEKTITANDTQTGAIILARTSNLGSSLFHQYSTTVTGEAFGLSVHGGTTLTDTTYTKYLVSQGGTHIWYGPTTANERARIDSSGRLLVGTSSNSGGALLQVNGDRIRVATAKTPASATDTGTAGEICWDASYIYVCTATNTWKRTAIATW